MIRDMIEGLQQKMADRQTEHMACNKKIMESEAKRDNAYSKVQELNAELVAGEGRKDGFIEDIKTLGEELATLNKTKTEQQALRDEIQKENEGDIAEAETALSGVKSALEVIQMFYSANAGNEVAPVMLQQSPKGPAADAPDAGFKNYEANKGAQETGVGIVGMLEVIIGDFERTIRETEAEEKENTKQHTAFLTETATSEAAKKQAQTVKTKLLKETKENTKQHTAFL